MRLNPNKTQRTAYSPHPDLLVGSTFLNSCDSFKIPGVIFESQFTFERHIHSISSLVAKKVNLLKKSFSVFRDHDILLKCFNSFILPCLEHCSPAWFSAADSHFKFLDKTLLTCKCLIPNLTVSLQHCCFISLLCIRVDQKTFFSKILYPVY